MGLGLEKRAAADGIEKLVAGAVVPSAGRVLIVRRSEGDEFLPGTEELPSGGVDGAETLLGALARELREEIGLILVVAEEGFVAHFDYEGRSGRKTRQYTFSVPHNGGDIRLSDEHSAYRWAAQDEVDPTDMTSESRTTLAVWFAWSGTASAAGT